MHSQDLSLQAWVKYDGSGRIVPGVLLVRKDQPAGKGWVALSAYLCCTTTSTTSTTSTSTTSTSTTTV